MMQERLDIVDRYLEGSLSEQERTAFEERLLQDEVLRQQVDDMKLMRASIMRASRKAALENLKALENALPLVEKKGLTLWTNIWLQAAAVLLIGLITYALWPASVDEQELLATHFEVYPNVIMPTVRGEIPNDSTLKALAFRAYDQKQFDEAGQLFNRIDSKDVNILFYLGNCYIATNQPDKALPLFESVLNDYNVFDEQAEWYIVISYLKLENRQKAKEVLKKIVASESSYKAKALLILEKLE
jgi:tetratricopeptide (TPR) repeat protein